MATLTITPVTKKIMAGDTVAWDVHVSGYSPDDSDYLEVTLINATEKHEFTVTTESSDYDGYFAFAMTSVQTAAITPGDFTVYYRACNSSDESEYVGTGMLTVLPDLSDAGTTLYDDRTHAETVLDAIQATIEGAASVDQMGISIAGRSLQRRTYDELLQLERIYKARVEAEKIQDQLGTTNSSGTIQTRMP